MSGELYKLKDICKIIAGQSPESKYYNTEGTGIPFFQGKADFGVLYPNIRVYCSQPTKIAEKDDILLSVRAPVGSTNLAPCRVCIGRGLTAIRPSEKLNLKYLLYFFRFFEAQLQQKGTGTTFKAITQDIVKNIEVPVPAIFEQERIVTRIDELFSELDNGVETLRKTKEQLVIYRQAVLNHEFSACVSEVPLKSVCKRITDGDHMPPPKSPSGIPFIMISNINNHKINWTNTSFVERKYFDNIDTKRKPQKGDVLYTVTGSFGTPVLVNFDKEFCFQRHIALLRPDTSILPKYLFYVLQTSSVYNQASEKSTGTAQKTVALSVLREMTIPYIEDKGIQDKIATSVQNKLSVCDSIEQTVNDALQQAVAMRQSILKKAFEGGL